MTGMVVPTIHRASVTATSASKDSRRDLDNLRATHHHSCFMIARLSGTLVEKHPNQIIVDVGGVGYDVTIPISTYSRLPEAGATVRLRIHTHVREDALSLYGFLTEEEKALFEKLISVSGIGPTLGAKVLSALAPADLIMPVAKVVVEG